VRQRKTAYNSTYKKLAVQWLNEVLCFVSSSVLADSFVLRNRHLRQARNRYNQWLEVKIENYKKSNDKLYTDN
jgi:hypothetical protein